MKKFVQTYFKIKMFPYDDDTFKFNVTKGYINVDNITEIRTGFKGADGNEYCQITTSKFKKCQWWCILIGWLGFHTKRYETYYIKKEDIKELI